MNKFKAALFDADGVAVLPPQLFSDVYAKEYGLELQPFAEFFRGDFTDAILGKADLKDLIRKNHDVWRWDGDPQELLDKWFAAENHPNSELINIIQYLKDNGLPSYLATHQERYRKRYLSETMFPDNFDGIFASSDIGFMKQQPEFWAHVLETLAIRTPDIQPHEVIFFDDSQSCVDGAEAAGIAAYLYTDIQRVRDALEL